MNMPKNMDSNKTFFKYALTAPPMLNLGILVGLHHRSGGERLFWVTLFVIGLLSFLFYYGRIFKRIYEQNKIGSSYVLSIFLIYFVATFGIFYTFFFLDKSSFLLAVLLLACVFFIFRLTENIYHNEEFKKIIEEEAGKMR